MALERKTFQLADLEVGVWIFVDINKNVWFKAKEIATFLGYKYPREAIRDNVAEINKNYWENLTEKFQEKDKLQFEIPKNWQKTTIFINESGLYQLLLRSRLPYAEKFQLWVTNEILPSIRVNNFYLYEQYFDELKDVIPSDKNIPGYVYVATTASYKSKNIFKIGMSINPEKRLSSLNSCSLEDYYFVNYTYVCDCRAIESLVHLHFDAKRVKREFFNLDEHDVLSIPQLCKNIENICFLK